MRRLPLLMMLFLHLPGCSVVEEPTRVQFSLVAPGTTDSQYRQEFDRFAVSNGYSVPKEGDNTAFLHASYRRGDGLFFDVISDIAGRQCVMVGFYSDDPSLQRQAQEAAHAFQIQIGRAFGRRTKFFSDQECKSTL